MFCLLLLEPPEGEDPSLELELGLFDVLRVVGPNALGEEVDDDVVEDPFAGADEDICGDDEVELAEDCDCEVPGEGRGGEGLLLVELSGELEEEEELPDED